MKNIWLNTPDDAKDAKESGNFFKWIDVALKPRDFVILNTSLDYFCVKRAPAASGNRYIKMVAREVIDKIRDVNLRATPHRFRRDKKNFLFCRFVFLFHLFYYSKISMN